MLQSDKGTEYKNVQFQSLLKECDIRFYTSENDAIKAAIIERFNRTLKTRMYRYFTHSKSFRYVDVLQDLVYSYKHTRHSSIGMESSMVSLNNEQRGRRKLFHLQPEKTKWKFKIGQQVRISKRRRVFEKGYVAGWSEEIFIVTCDVHDQRLADEQIKERFYEPELQLIVKEDNVTSKRYSGQEGETAKLNIKSSEKAIRTSLVPGQTHAESTQ